MSTRSKSFVEWYGDESLGCALVLKQLSPFEILGTPGRSWVEFTIYEPSREVDGEEPVVEGHVTLNTFEWHTIGAYDGDLDLLFGALRRTESEAKALMRQAGSV